MSWTAGEDNDVFNLRQQNMYFISIIIFVYPFSSQNILFGVGGAVIALIGEWTLQKQRTFLYLSVSVLLANVVNLVVLEIAEWHIFLPEAAKKLTEQGNLNKLVLYGEYTA